MKIPNKDFTIKVSGFTFDVIYSWDIANQTESFGRTDSNNQKIFIDPSRKQQKIEQTFLHELLHAIHFVNGISYRFDKGKLEEQPSEEDVCREDSMILYQVIKDNPKIFT